MKNEPSVTMKLGRAVLITRRPLRNPMVNAKASDATMASHTFQPASEASIPIRRPADPVMAPADKSNSPPIISRATATAMMPSVDAGSR